MIRRPTHTMTGVVRVPRVWDVVLVTFLAAAVAGALLMRTAVGQQALVDQWESAAAAFGQPVDDGEYARLQDLAVYGPAYAVLTAALSGPVVTLVTALALALVFGSAGGTRRSFHQILAVTAHAGVVLGLRQVVGAPLAYLRESTASVTSLGRLLPLLNEASGSARFAGLLDGFVLWWAVVLAIGVSRLFGVRTSRVAAGFIGVYFVLALALAGVMATVGSRL